MTKAERFEAIKQETNGSLKSIFRSIIVAIIFWTLLGLYIWAHHRGIQA